MAARTLQITYVGDAAKVLGAQKQIDAGHTQMQGGVQKTSSMFQQAFGAAIPLTAVAAGIAVAGLAKTTIQAAADEGEALNKATVVFGDASSSVIAFSDTSAKAFGISKAAALEAAGGFGSMLQTAGLAEDAAAGMSVEMVQLAADMASFNNQDPSDMLDRLRSGLAGESEPLRQFGVFISDARVKTEAYTSGIAAAGEELTEAQKVQARYNLIMQDTVKQQGDFARTSDSLPNQLRTLSATFTDLAADVGLVLLPVITETLGLFADLGGPVLQLVADNAGLVLSVFAGYVALRFVPELLFTMALGFERVGLTAGANAAVGVSAFLKSLGPAIPIIGTAITAGILLGDALDGAGQSFEEAGAAIETALLQRLTEGEITFQQYSAAVDEANEKGEGLVVVSGEAGRALADQRAKAAILEGQMRTLSGEEEYAAQQTEALTEEIREQRLAMLALSDSFLGIIDSANQVSDAQRELNRLERQGRDDTKAYEEAVLTAIGAQIGLEESVLSFGLELAKAGKEQREVERAVRDAAREYDINEDAIRDIIRQVREYINSLNDIPEQIQTSVGINFPPGFTPPQQVQHGIHGIVSEPTLFLAGEGGSPERVDVVPLGANGHRRNGHAARAAGIVVNIHIGTLVGGSEAELARLVRDELLKLERRNVTTGLGVV